MLGSNNLQTCEKVNESGNVFQSTCLRETLPISLLYINILEAYLIHIAKEIFNGT